MNMNPATLPAINATLNAIAGVLLVVALVFIKQKRIAAHRNTMLAAFGVSAVFLVTYVTDKIMKGGAHTPFRMDGVIRILYYVILITHILLAITVPVFAVTLIRLGLKRRDAAHRRLARIAWPIWMYVSVTGVLIYFMLYHWNPSA